VISGVTGGSGAEYKGQHVGGQINAADKKLKYLRQVKLNEMGWACGAYG